MKKFIILFVFALFLIGCESEGTYSGICTDKDGNRIIFREFKIFYDPGIASVPVLRNRSYTMEMRFDNIDELYMYRDGGKFDKNNQDKEDYKREIKQ